MPQKHKDGTKAISVWLDEKDRELLKQLVELGFIKDRSDFIRREIAKKAKAAGLTTATEGNKEKNAHE
jgi:Arc/MetJ-type ribon-helix-helix transcriptional regulator